MSTVGFGELRPLSPLGKVFTAVLILFGVGNLAYAATKTTEAIIERRLLRRRRMQMEIKRLSDHVVVCGYGRMGMTVCDHLRARCLKKRRFKYRFPQRCLSQLRT